VETGEVRENQNRCSVRTRIARRLKSGVDVRANRFERWEVLMSRYEQQHRAWKQGRARERKMAQQVPQDSQGAEKQGGHADKLVQTQ
jgi:hypothetical protein